MSERVGGKSPQGGWLFGRRVEDFLLLNDVVCMYDVCMYVVLCGAPVFLCCLHVRSGSVR